MPPVAMWALVFSLFGFRHVVIPHRLHAFLPEYERLFCAIVYGICNLKSEVIGAQIIGCLSLRRDYIYTFEQILLGLTKTIETFRLNVFCIWDSSEPIKTREKILWLKKLYIWISSWQGVEL